MLNKTRTATTAIVMAVALLVAGCGSNGSDDAKDDGPVDTAPRVLREASATGDEFCDGYIDFVNSVEMVEVSDGVDRSDENAVGLDLATQSTDLALEQLDRVRDAAPDELTDSLDVITEAYEKQRDAVAEASSVEEIPSDILFSDEMNEAGETVGNYVLDNCEIDDSTFGPADQGPAGQAPADGAPADDGDAPVSDDA